ncbi:MAG TPA: hypothetical protein VFM09_05310 [Marmoricola sp.]|nr:hypothetical protein [Marmoricola sp.]
MTIMLHLRSVLLLPKWLPINRRRLARIRLRRAAPVDFGVASRTPLAGVWPGSKGYDAGPIPSDTETNADA